MTLEIKESGNIKITIIDDSRLLVNVPNVRIIPKILKFAIETELQGSTSKSSDLIAKVDSVGLFSKLELRHAQRYLAAARAIVKAINASPVPIDEVYDENDAKVIINKSEINDLFDKSRSIMDRSIAVPKIEELTEEDFEHSDFITVECPEIRNRTAVFDLEVNCPAFGKMTQYTQLLCASFLPLEEGAKPYTLSINFEDYRNDLRLLKLVRKELEKYQFIIGHNVKGFDLNWISTRCAYYRMDLPKRLHYYDTYSAERRMPLLHRKGLGSGIDFFKMKDAVKTQIDPNQWDKINSPHKADFDAAKDMIVYHNVQDVIANKKLYDIIYRYDPKPSWRLWPW